MWNIACTELYIIHWFSGSHGGDYEKHYLLECDHTVSYPRRQQSYHQIFFLKENGFQYNANTLNQQQWEHNLRLKEEKVMIPKLT